MSISTVQNRGRPLVVFCAGSSWDAPAGTDRHIASRLSRWGTVIYVDPSLSLRPKNLKHLFETDFKEVSDGVLRLTPCTSPGATYPGLRDFAQFNTRRVLRAKIRSLGMPVHSVVIASLDDLFGICKGSQRVFFGTDDFVAGASLMSMDHDWVIRRETRQLGEATHVVAISEQIADRWRNLGYNVTVVQNGCDSAAYALTDETPPAPDVLLPSPIAGLIGQLSNRLDWSYLEAVADRGISLLLIGPLTKQTDTARFQRLISRENVQWVGAQPFAKLPSYLKTIKVGITPYVNSEFNRASFPLKTLEYLAAGRAAVVSDLPSCRTLATDLVRIAVTPGDFADAVEDELQKSDTKQLRQQRQAFSQRHSWERRAQEFALAIGLAPDSQGIGTS